MAGNNIQGTLSISTAAAQRELRAAARAMEEVQKAGADVTIAQRAAAKSLSDTANKTLSENRKLAESYAKIAREAIESTRKMEQADKDALASRKRLNAESAARVNKTNSATNDQSELAALKRETEEIRQQSMLRRAGDQADMAALARETEQARTLLLTRKAMTEEARQTAVIQESAAKRASLALRDQLAVQRQMGAVSRGGNNLLMGGLGFTGLRYALYDVAQGFQAVGIAAAAVTTAVFGAAVSWERAFADVRRTMSLKNFDGTLLDPAEQDRVGESLRRELVTIAQTKPIDWAEITQTAQLGNQLGVAAGAIGNFTRTVTEFGAVTGVSVDVTATAFGRLNTLVPGVKNNFSGLGDSIAKVGVSSAATEAQILKVATQISSVATTAGLSYQEVIGFSGALASIAVPPELSRSVLTRVFGDISRAVSGGGADLQNFAKISGMSAKDFGEAWDSGHGGAEIFTNFLNGIKQAGPDAEQAIRGLGITSVRDVPTLIRLANAMDSTGEAGGLLAESINNANNAAGELDRQYGIIANTVDSKVKVAFNNLQAIFANIGSSDLGFLGDVLDSATDALREFFKTLNDNANVLGFELPFSNAEALGTVAVITGITGALSLMFSVAGRGAANWIAIREVFDTLRASKGIGPGVSGSIVALNKSLDGARVAGEKSNVTFSNSARTFGTLTGQVVTADTKFKNFVNTGNSFAGTTDRIGRSFAGVTSPLGKNLDQYGRLSQGLVSVQRGFYGATDAIGNFAGGGTRLGGVLDNVRGKIDGAVSGLASFGKTFGPELAIGAVIALGAAITTLEKQAYGVHSETGEIVNTLNKGKTAAQQFVGVQVNNAGWLSALGVIPNDLQSVITNTKQFGEALNVVGMYGDNTWGDLNQQVLDVGRTFADGEPTWVSSMQTIDALDDAFGQMADNGNIDGVVTAVGKLTDGLNPDQITTFLSRADDLSNALATKLLSLGVEDTLANRVKLIQGGYNDMLDAAAGFAAGTTDAFEEADADTTAFVTSISEAISGAVSSSDAWAAAQQKAADANAAAAQSWEDAGNPIADFVGTAKASLDDYFTTMDTQIANQQNFVRNIATIMQQAGPEYATAAAALGADFTQALVDGGGDALTRFKEQTDSQIPDVIGTLSASIASLTPDVTAKIGTLGEEAGAEFYRRLFTGEDINSLLNEFGLGDGVTVPVNPTVTPGSKITAEAQLDALAGPRSPLYSPEVDAPAEETAAQTFARLAQAHEVPYGPNVVGFAKDAVQKALDAIAAMREANYSPETVQAAQEAVAFALKTLGDPRTALFNAAMGADNASWELDRIAAQNRTTYITAKLDTSQLPDIPGVQRFGIYKGGQAGAVAGLPGFASGRVPGARLANKKVDNIPAMIRSREWIIPEESADKYGSGLLNGIVNRTLDTASLYRPVPVMVNGGGGNSNRPTQVELSPYDRALLRASGAKAPTVFAPSDVAAAASTGNTSTFRKGGN